MKAQLQSCFPIMKDWRDWGKMKEIWKDIEGYEGLYQVSNLGNIKSFPRRGTQARNEKVLKPTEAPNKYLCVFLYKNGEDKKMLVHRLVAQAFLDNERALPQVNHINGIKSDNRVVNLEWCTAKENERHAFDTGLHKVMSGEEHFASKKIIQYSKDKTFIKEWVCARQIEKELGISHSNISNCCQHKRKTAGGYIWEYK